MRRICGILWLLCFSNLIIASDFSSPEWRNLPGSTYQKWTFSANKIYYTADSYSNPYGMPSAANIIDGRWFTQIENQQGVLEAKSIDFYVPADVTKSDTKYRVEMIWDVQATSLPNLHLYVGDGSDTMSFIEADIIKSSLIPNSSRWRYTIFEITIPTPTSTPVVYFEAEFTHIPNKSIPIYVDEVIIDTMPIPEPTTLLLLGAGGLMLRRKS
jgi:hypothetical protein